MGLPGRTGGLTPANRAAKAEHACFAAVVIAHEGLLWEQPCDCHSSTLEVGVTR